MRIVKLVDNAQSFLQDLTWPGPSKDLKVALFPNQVRKGGGVKHPGSLPTDRGQKNVFMLTFTRSSFRLVYFLSLVDQLPKSTSSLPTQHFCPPQRKRILILRKFAEAVKSWFRIELPRSEILYWTSIGGSEAFRIIVGLNWGRCKCQHNFQFSALNMIKFRSCPSSWLALEGEMSRGGGLSGWQGCLMI